MRVGKVRLLALVALFVLLPVFAIEGNAPTMQELFSRWDLKGIVALLESGTAISPMDQSLAANALWRADRF